MIFICFSFFLVKLEIYSSFISSVELTRLECFYLLDPLFVLFLYIYLIFDQWVQR